MALIEICGSSFALWGLVGLNDTQQHSTQCNNRSDGQGVGVREVGVGEGSGKEKGDKIKGMKGRSINEVEKQKRSSLMHRTNKRK